MHSGMIGKIEKAHRYAEERTRFDIGSMSITVHGNNSDHQVRFDDGSWHCECEFFVLENACAHTMALERILDGMIHPQGAIVAA
jgi:hypothetical protein